MFEVRKNILILCQLCYPAVITFIPI